MEKRLKLLESGGAVVKPGGQGQKKWEAKAERKGYNETNDFTNKKQRVWIVILIFSFIISFRNEKITETITTKNKTVTTRYVKISIDFIHNLKSNLDF